MKTTILNPLKRYSITPFLGALSVLIIYLFYLALDGFFFHKEHISALGAVILMLYAGTSVVILTLEQLIVRKTFKHFSTFWSIEAILVVFFATTLILFR